MTIDWTGAKIPANESVLDGVSTSSAEDVDIEGRWAQILASNN